MRMYVAIAILVAALAVSPAFAKKDPVGTCAKKCDYQSGAFDYWNIPEYEECKGDDAGPLYNSKPFCAAGAINVADCCAACTDAAKTGKYDCQYWIHIPSSLSETGCKGRQCGKCLLMSSVDGISLAKGGGKKMRVGEVCPYTKDDPHFFGAHGTRYDFNGLPDKSFCLFTDRRVHVNMGMRGYFDERTQGAALLVNGKAVRTWIRQLAVMWHADDGASHSLVLTARDGKAQSRGEGGFLSSAELDGQVLPKLQVGESASLAGGLVFTFVGMEMTGPYEVDAFTVKVGDLMELDLKLRVAHPLLQTPTEAHAHINVMFNYVAPTEDVHGVMGQTFRDGREEKTAKFSHLAAVLHHPVSAEAEEGKGFLDGAPTDYETTVVTAADCRFTAFNGEKLPVA